MLFLPDWLLIGLLIYPGAAKAIDHALTIPTGGLARNAGRG
jgi:hypothetical protein